MELEEKTRSIDPEAVERLVAAKEAYREAHSRFADRISELEKQRAALATEIEVAAAQKQRDLEYLQSRELHSRREEGVARRDVLVLRKLEQGARMAEAEAGTK